MTVRKKKTNPRAHSKRRIRLAELGCTAVCLGFTFVFGGKYLVLPIISSTYQANKNSVTYNAIKDYVVEGDILDRNGNVIMGNAMSGVPATASYPENVSYSYLLGYYTVSSGTENAYGLRGNLKDYSLFHLDSESKGATVTLTTDNGLQDYAYSLLDGQEGSITVIENSTGAIRCLTSESTITYDVNDINTLLTTDVEGSQYRRGTYETDPPGSTFKIVAAAAALTAKENGKLSDDDFQYYDTGEYVPEGSDFTITNYESDSYGQCDLERAMNYSVNCYFANLGVKTGYDQLKLTMEAFKVGSSIEIPYLTTLRSSYDMTSSDTAEIAQTAFGQGKTQITPVHLTLIAQAVANNGVMMSPYVVSSIRDGSTPLYQHFDSKLSTCIDQTVDDELKTILHSTAVRYGFDEYTYGMVYAKTGTAECTGDRLHTYLVGFTDKYSFCISINNGTHSYELYPTARALVSYLNNMD